MSEPTRPELPQAPRPQDGPRTPEESAPQPSRRALFGMLGGGAAGLAVGAAGGAVANSALAASGPLGSDAAGTTRGVVPFEGAHQAGIVTPAQDRLHFASFEMLHSAGRDELISLLRDWTVAARELTAGRDIGSGAVGGPLLAPPDDTGEAQGLSASNLTLTFGLGRELFADRSLRGGGTEADPFGLRERMPASFAPLPSFAFDLLDPATTGGDLCVQACADDPQVAVHAIRNLSRIAMGRARIVWSQLGFGRTSSTSQSQETPRNLFGFKDGTANVKAEETKALAQHVWVADGPEWIRGGSYLVARKIAMTIESWDRTTLQEQERVIGRTKGEGGPLSGGGEFTEPDFTRTRTSGGTAIDIAAHVRLAHPSKNHGVRLLRRGYNYVDGNNPLGQLGAGLFFISYQSDPSAFVTVQRALKTDALNEYIRHVGSGLWAVPRGVGSGEFVGQALFD